MSKEKNKNNSSDGYDVFELDFESEAFEDTEEDISEYEKTVAEIENRKGSGKFVRFLRKFIPWHGDGAKEIFRKIVFVVALAVFIFSLVYIINYEVDKYHNEKVLSEVSDQLNTAEENIEKQVQEKIDAELQARYEAYLAEMGLNDADLTDAQREEILERLREQIRQEVYALNVAQLRSLYPDVEFPDGIIAKYAYLYAGNQDLVGWIRVPNTVISYPVVQSDDNNYYLRKNFYGEYSRFGTVFADYRNNVKNGIENFNTNTILYGHYLYTGTMFTELRTYKTLEGYKKSPVIYFDTLTDSYAWKVVSVFITNTNAKDDNGYVFNYTSLLGSYSDFDNFVSEIKERSIINTGVDVQADDHLLTLSTCDFDFDDARLVVVARLVREGEDENVDTSKSTLNANPKYPQAWYDKRGLTNPFKRQSTVIVPTTEVKTTRAVESTTEPLTEQVIPTTRAANRSTTFDISNYPTLVIIVTEGRSEETTQTTTASTTQTTTRPVSTTTRRATTATTATTAATTTAAATSATTAAPPPVENTEPLGGE